MADDPKLAEFRDKNIALLKELDDLKTKYAGIDPDAVKADRAKLAEFDTVKTQLAARDTELATERAARLSAEGRINTSLLKDAVTSAFLKAGGRGSAADYIVAKASDKLAVENGVVVGKVFDPNRPGEKLTVDGFIAMQVRESDFAFLPSSGGGAHPAPGGGGPSRGNELRDPTPQQLGEHAADIKAGRLKVVYSNS